MLRIVLPWWQIYDRAHHDELRARTGADAGMLLSLPENVGSVLRSPEELSAVEAAQVEFVRWLL